MNKNIFIFGLILILFSFIVNGATTLTTDLIAYYTLDNTVNDSYTTNHGTQVGGSFINISKLGDYSYNTGTTNVRIDLPFGSLTKYNEISVNFWARSITSGSLTGFDHGNFFAVYLPSPCGRFRVYGYGSGGSQGKILFQSCDNSYLTAGRWDNAKWFMATITHKYPGNYTFYLNGTKIYTSASAGAINATYNFIIGARRTSSVAYSEYVDNAYIGDMGFWEKELSESEVYELYNGGNGIRYPFGDEPEPPSSNCSCTGTANCLLPCNYQLNGTCNVGNYIITINGTGTFTGFNYLKNWNTGYIRGGCNVYN